VTIARLGAADLRLAEAFLGASRGGDMAVLLDLLAPDVVRTVDQDLVRGRVATEVRGAGRAAGLTITMPG
jgi:RNA polymerase sigma-70 factor (ECF subfamily)